MFRIVFDKGFPEGAVGQIVSSLDYSRAPVSANQVS